MDRDIEELNTRLHRVRQLFDRGGLTLAEYTAAREAILAGQDQPAPPPIPVAVDEAEPASTGVAPIAMTTPPPLQAEIPAPQDVPLVEVPPPQDDPVVDVPVIGVTADPVVPAWDDDPPSLPPAVLEVTVPPVRPRPRPFGGPPPPGPAVQSPAAHPPFVSPDGDPPGRQEPEQTIPALTTPGTPPSMEAPTGRRRFPFRHQRPSGTPPGTPVRDPFEMPSRPVPSIPDSAPPTEVLRWEEPSTGKAPEVLRWEEPTTEPSAATATGPVAAPAPEILRSDEPAAEAPGDIVDARPAAPDQQIDESLPELAATAADEPGVPPVPDVLSEPAAEPQALRREPPAAKLPATIPPVTDVAREPEVLRWDEPAAEAPATIPPVTDVAPEPAVFLWAEPSAEAAIDIKPDVLDQQADESVPDPTATVAAAPDVMSEPEVLRWEALPAESPAEATAPEPDVVSDPAAIDTTDASAEPVVLRWDEPPAEPPAATVAAKPDIVPEAEVLRWEPPDAAEAPFDIVDGRPEVPDQQADESAPAPEPEALREDEFADTPGPELLPWDEPDADPAAAPEPGVLRWDEPDAEPAAEVPAPEREVLRWDSPPDFPAVDPIPPFPRFAPPEPVAATLTWDGRLEDRESAWQPAAGPRDPYPVHYAVAYPGRPSRRSTAVRGPLILPLVVMGVVVGLLVNALLLFGWAAVFAHRRYPAWAFSALSSVFGFQARAWAYGALQTDRYPSFDPGDSPVELTFEAPPPDGTLSRWRVLFWKLLLALPYLAVLAVMVVAVAASTVVAWVAILATARYPRPLFAFNEAVTRSYFRVAAYIASFNDQLPAFSLSPRAGAATSMAATVSGAFTASLLLAFAVSSAFIVSRDETGGGTVTTLAADYSDLVANRPAAPPLVFKGSRRSPEISVSLIRVEDDVSEGRLLEVKSSERLVVFTWTVRNGLEDHVLPPDAVWFTFRDGGTLRAAAADLLTVDGRGAPLLLPDSSRTELRAAFVVPREAVAERIDLRFNWPGAGAMSEIVYNFK